MLRFSLCKNISRFCIIPQNTYDYRRNISYITDDNMTAEKVAGFLVNKDVFNALQLSVMIL